uniref:Uncharacterized protein n=1 Tax=Setaria viridis TaxID=4556 RepID=A0A4U6VKR5_SETVI|nr:hypothetical protein SEVIR_3G328400v2 [Setaria viridis]
MASSSSVNKPNQVDEQLEQVIQILHSNEPLT